MGNENGEWIIHGVKMNDPNRIRNVEELEAYINKVGFLPLFACDIPGFSVEERTVAKYWWSGDAKNDPWEWRAIVARRGNIVYGKFFDKKAGFISKEWLPVFANFRRDGYDFDSLWDDQKASARCKKIMDLFEDNEELYSYEVKEKAGFGKDGEKNFEGTITSLQMMLYLCNKDFRQKINKKGEPYGWAVSVYTIPEKIWGRDDVTACYKEDPKDSWQKVCDYMRKMYPGVTDRQIKKNLWYKL